MTGGFFAKWPKFEDFFAKCRDFFAKWPKFKDFFAKCRGFFLQNDLSSRTFLQNDRKTQDLDRPPGRSDGRELRATWRDAVAELGPGLES